MQRENLKTTPSSFLKKVVILTTFLIFGIIAVQTFIYTRLETESLRESLIRNKEDFAELLALNLGAAQEIGGLAFQSRLIQESGGAEDTVYVRFVKPDGTIYLSSISKERGEYIETPPMDKKTITRDDIFDGEKIKTIISKGAGEYTVWLGFSTQSIQKTIKTTILSRILLSAGIMLVGIGLVYILALRVTKDIRALKEAAKEIGKGNLDIEARIKSKDDIGDLGAQFNQMTKNLKESRKKLSDYSINLKRAKTAIEREKVKLETLLRNIGEGIIAMDLKGNIIILNKQAEKMFGKKFEECMGKPYKEIFEIINEKGKKMMMNNYPIITCILTKKPIIGKAHFIEKGKDPIPLSTTISPIIFKGKILGIIGTFRDITEDEKIDKAKTEFVSLASHQLQTPLTAIRWFLEILMYREKLTKHQMEYVKKAFVSNQRMIKLVEDFLNVSRLEGGMISVYPKEGDFVKFIKGLVEEARVIAEKRGQKIIFSKSDSKIIGTFDPNLVSQIVLNLLSNAIHYSGEKTTIKVDVNKKAKKIEIIVKDNGIGVSEEDQERLFTKFFRTKKSRKISTTGSGLGLYIVKKILDACKGTISCKSEKNKGSLFRVSLPLKGVSVQGVKKLIENRIS